MSIRREVSQILGFTIPKDGWDQAFKTLNAEGKVDKKHIAQILLAVVKRLEKLEKNE